MSDNSDFFAWVDEVDNFISSIPKLIQEEGEPAMLTAMADLQAELVADDTGSIYPNELPNQKYVRTFDLMRSVYSDSEFNDDTLTGIVSVGGGLDYAPWVVGPDYPGEIINGNRMYQASIHQNRWWQFFTVIDENINDAWDNFKEILFERLIERWIKKENTDA